MSDAILEMSSKNWDKEVIRTSMPVLVTFWSPGCENSTKLAPKVENLTNKFGGRIKFGRVNIQENPDLANQYKVTRTPHCMVFNGGNKAAHQLVGVISESDLSKLLNYVLGVVNE